MNCITAQLVTLKEQQRIIYEAIDNSSIDFKPLIDEQNNGL